MSARPKYEPASPIPDDIVDTLRLEGVQGIGVPDYPNRLAFRFRNSEIAQGLIQIATIVEPADRALGIDPSRNVEKAYRMGELLGLRVTAACVEDVDAAFRGIDVLSPTIATVQDADKYHERQLIASGLIELGSEAYAKVDEIFDPLFDEWENQLVPDIRHQRFLRSGFGIPVSYLFKLHDLNATQEMERLAQSAENGDLKWEDLLVQ